MNKKLLLVFFAIPVVLIIVVLLIKKNEVVDCQWMNLNVIKQSNSDFITKDAEGNIWHKIRIQIGRDKNSEISHFMNLDMIKDFDGSREPFFYHVQNLRPNSEFYLANISKISDFEILDEFMSNNSASLELGLVSMDITEEVVACLARYKGLVCLKFYSCSIKSPLKFKSDYLSYLKFVSMELNDNLSMFSECNIDHFDAVDCKIDQQAIITISAFEKIERLCLESINPKLLPNDISLFNKMQNLKYLELNSALDNNIAEWDFTSSISMKGLTITLIQNGKETVPKIKVNDNCKLVLNRETNKD